MKIAVNNKDQAKKMLFCFHLKKNRKQIPTAKATIGPLEEQAYTKNMQLKMAIDFNKLFLMVKSAQRIGKIAAAKDPNRIE
ncbi:hypothetical protein KAR91_71140 [Candidatus Pacearchaeota archaeon]|nr:hypothetical protein [Candidatus Pacearchaeota archaeon]